MVNCANVAEQYKKNKDLKKHDVVKLMEWLEMQPHLPKISELEAIVFLHSCYYSNEATKKCIDNYYTVHNVCPEFFANRNPSNAEIQTCIKYIANIPLSKTTPEGYMIFYNSILNPNTDEYSFNSCIKLFDMGSSLFHLENGTKEGHIIVIDLKGCTLTHVVKIGILSLKKTLYYLQEALPYRLRGIHFVNAVPFMDKIMALIKPFMKKELIEMVYIHLAPNDSIFKVIPRDCLANECGGTLGSINDIAANWNKKLVENTDYFLEEEKMVVDESKRPGKPRDAGELFGVEGTFKKLDLD